MYKLFITWTCTLSHIITRSLGQTTCAPCSLKNGKYAVIRVCVRKICRSIVNYSDHYFTALSIGLEKLTCGNDIGHVSNGQLTLLPLQSWKEEVKYKYI